MKIILLGASGLVGRTVLKVLENNNYSAIPKDIELVAAASERSAGKQVYFRGKPLSIITAGDALKEGGDIAIFSAGADASREWAPRFAEKGIRVIDNSSAFRREKEVPLVIPEVNGDQIREDSYIIANPNCSTIQMVAVLAPLHLEYQIKRIVVATYQSVTGSGLAGVRQLDDERKGVDGPKAYPHPIDLNVIPQGGEFMDDGSTAEEDKLVFETQKILGNEDIKVSATVVRVPVKGGHSEAVNVTFNHAFKLSEVKSILGSTPGIFLMDDPRDSIYPTPLQAEGRDDVLVGRLRRDASAENALNMWIVADNLRKGAATNAVQIANYIISTFLSS